MLGDEGCCILPGFEPGGDDGYPRPSKMLSLWGLVPASCAQCLSSTVLPEAGMPSGQQALEPAEMVAKEPGVLSRAGEREAGPGVAAGAPWILEADGCQGTGGSGGCVTRSLDLTRL